MAQSYQLDILAPNVSYYVSFVGMFDFEGLKLKILIINVLHDVPASGMA
jgi:hypothetical protein